MVKVKQRDTKYIKKDQLVENFNNNHFLVSEEEMLKNNKKKFITNQPLKDIQSNDSEDEVMMLNEGNEEIFNIEDVKENFDLPNGKAWGKEKKMYYHTDYIDSDYAFNNQKNIIDAEMEEQEAKNLQNRLAETLDETDFGLDLIVVKPNNSNFYKNIEQVKADLSKLSKRKKNEFLNKESPELMPLVLDYQECLTEAKTVLKPFLDLIKKINCQDCLAIDIIKAKYNILLHYCMNISFYLTLKSKGESLDTHPLIKKLTKYRHLLAQIQSNQKYLVKNVVKILKANNRGKCFIYPINMSKKSARVKSKKTSAVCENNFENKDESQLSLKENFKIKSNNECEPKKIKEEKRSITYQIAKNRGLTPYRKKELRNPRVKHRNKYHKAKICRKGSVREVRKETTRYEGEISGIKARISKSIKLK